MLTMHPTLNRALIASAVVASLAIAHDASAQADRGYNAQGSDAISITPHYTKAAARLERATQKLSDAIEAMSREQVGAGRDRAIDEAHEALIETHRAMTQLPPEVQAGANGTVDYSVSMERLRGAAQTLRTAAQAMAQAPAGEDRNRAIKQVNQALFDTTQAMIALPPDMRVAGK